MRCFKIPMGSGWAFAPRELCANANARLPKRARRMNYDIAAPLYRDHPLVGRFLESGF